MGEREHTEEGPRSDAAHRSSWGHLETQVEMQEALPAQLLSSLVLGSPGHLPVSQRLGPPQSHTVSFLGNR